MGDRRDDEILQDERGAGGGPGDDDGATGGDDDGGDDDGATGGRDGDEDPETAEYRRRLRRAAGVRQLRVGAAVAVVGGAVRVLGDQLHEGPALGAGMLGMLELAGLGAAFLGALIALIGIVTLARTRRRPLPRARVVARE